MPLKELEDYDWFPARLRRYQMEFISFLTTKFPIYMPLINLRPGHKTIITDLCTGTGAPAELLSKIWRMPVLKTDKFPFSHDVQMLDALNLKTQSGYTYTMFNAFHHFSEIEQYRMVDNITSSGGRICFVEILRPNILDFVKIGLTTTIGQWLITPWIKPFDPLRILFTYVIPINVITITYDGLVSVLKAKSVKYYEGLFSPIDSVEVMDVNSWMGTKLTIIKSKGL